MFLLKGLMFEIFRKHKYLAGNCNFSPTKWVLQQFYYSDYTLSAWGLAIIMEN